MKESSALDKLVRAEGSSWDPKLACLPGTRVEILSMLNAWAHSPRAHSVLWLKGVAGSGKSAISHTFAQALHNAGLLASSFFFSRNDAARNTPQYLFTTITSDISARHPIIASDISTSLAEDPSLASASLSRQFQAFILGPLLRHTIAQAIVIVIDALDETLADDSDTSLLDIFCDEACKLPPNVRILVTSRPLWTVEQSFSGEAHITSYSIDINSNDNLQDISLFIDANMNSKMLRKRMGPTWPDAQMIAELKVLAEGLFIWAATVCRYICSVYSPMAALRDLLSKSGQQGLATNRKMDDLYASILEACADWEDAIFLEDYKRIMGAIMALKRPLSLAALRALHVTDLADSSAVLLLERFGSVLTGFRTDHEAISMLHITFREFITDRANHAPQTRKFYLPAQVHSARLAELCLETINCELSDINIHGIGYLEEGDNIPPGIPDITGVSEQLLYSCESWMEHLQDISKPNETVVHLMHTFLSQSQRVCVEILASRSEFHGSLLPLCGWAAVTFFGN